MGAIGTLLTIADLRGYPDDGMHREILFGELIESPSRGFQHSNTQAGLGRGYQEGSFLSLARVYESHGLDYSLSAPM